MRASARDPHPARPLNVAFVTPDYPTERGGGGVGSYVSKMASLLVDRGHACTVIVVSDEQGRGDFDGITVVRVPRSRSLLARGGSWLLRRMDPVSGYLPAYLENARRLAAALESEHARDPFDLVQSANLHLVGSAVRPSSGRKHLIRISTSRLLYDPASGRSVTRLAEYMERQDVAAQRRADASYAPSRLLQDHFRRTYGLPVGLVRPPLPGDIGEAASPPPGLPDRYLVHYGVLGPRKGTDVVARALEIAWATEPGLRMVWAGPASQSLLSSTTASWGDRAANVAVLGPLEKRVLYGVVKGAVASVLPSRMDNLPNTVIESLAMGVPVIGTSGSSVDELVRDGVSGLVVPPADAAALATAMVEVWRGRSFPDVTPPPEMEPDRAVAGLLDFAGLGRGTTLV